MIGTDAVAAPAAPTDPADPNDQEPPSLKAGKYSIDETKLQRRDALTVGYAVDPVTQDD